MSDKTEKRNVDAIGPVTFNDLRLEKPANYAAGINSITSALQHSFKELGISKSFKVLSHLNQKGGLTVPVVHGQILRALQNLGNFVRMELRPSQKKQQINYWIQTSLQLIPSKNFQECRILKLVKVGD